MAADERFSEFVNKGNDYAVDICFTAFTGVPIMAESSSIDTHEMLLIHRVIRRELGLLPAQLRCAAGDRTRTACIAAHASEMLEFVHIHHGGEDELVWPVLRPRVSLEEALIDRMQTQHDQIATSLDTVRAQLPEWADSADPDAAEYMATQLESIHEVLLAHLAEEEEHILPLVSTHFSQSEWDALGQHGLAAVPAKRRFVVLGYILEDTDTAERTGFLRRLPPPVRIAFKLIGQRQFARELAAVRG